MEWSAVEEAVSVLKSSGKVPADVWRLLVSLKGADEVSYLASLARETALSTFGKAVYVRALIEISSFCRNGCRYCGLRSANRFAARYRLSKEQIMECSHAAAAAGFSTFVLQGGEDPQQNDEWLAGVVSSLKAAYPDKAVTLSVGERATAGYALLREAGADRYLLRHETANEEHYSMLHPQNMSAKNRRRCLADLKRLGYQTGSGMMVGSPGQTTGMLVDDLMFLDELEPQMIGIGPFIPASGTPFAGEPAGNVEKTLLLVSLLRLRFPRALIPATTAIATLCSEGTERAVLSGANVVMPNVSPAGVREKYSIYDNKKSSGSESLEQLDLLGEKLGRIGYFIDYSRGDYPIEQ